jgi:UDP-N-acetyl-D-mannosaminuronic acid transferase (WecB/TagA/CpsF family)
MSVHAMTRAVLGFGIAALLLAPAVPAAGQDAAGQEKKMVFEEQDTMAAVLKRLEGKAVRIRLAGGGEEVVGKLEKVGKELAHLSNLSGREFFDAAVRIDQVASVAVQVRGR